MQSVNGDVRLSVGLNINSIPSTLSNLKKKITDTMGAFKGASSGTKAVEDVDTKMMKLSNDVEKAAEKLEVAKSKLKEFEESAGGTAKKSEEYKALQKEIEATDKEFNRLVDLQEQWASSGLADTPGFKDLDVQVEALAARYEELTAKQKALEAEAAKSELSGAKYQQLSSAVNQASRDYDLAKTKLQEYNTAQSEMAAKSAASSQKVKKAMALISSGTSAVISKFAEFGKKAKSAFSGVVSRLKSMAKSAVASFSSMHKNVNGGIKSFFKYALGIRGLFALFRKLRTAAKEGYTNLAQYSSSVNENVSGVTSAMTKLKNAIAVAVQPIVNLLAPVLQSLINILAEAANSVAQFMAAFTGQSYAYKAVDTQTQFAESLDDTADSAKSAEKALNSYLSPLDEINTFTPPSTADTGAGTGAAGTAVDASTMFETVEVDSKFKDLAEKVKGYFKDAFAPLKNAWDKYGNGVVNSIKKAFGNIKNVIGSIGQSFAKVWQNGSGEKVVGDILKIFKDIFDIIGNIAGAFADAWNTDGIGDDITQAIFDIIGSITGGIEKIAKAIGSWAKGLDFQPLLKAFDGLLQAIKPLVDICMNGLYWVWENVLAPLGTWTIEQGIPGLITGIADAINILTGNTQALNPNLQFLGDFVNNIYQGIFNLGEAFLGLGTIFVENSQPIIDGAQTLVDGLGTFASSVIDIVGEAFNIATADLSAWINDSDSEISTFIGNLSGTFGDLETLIGSIFGDIGDILSEWWNGEGGKEIFDNAVNAILGVADSVMKFWDTYVQPVVDFIADAVQSLWDNCLKPIVDKVVEIIGKLVDAISTFWNNWLKPIVDFVMDTVGPAFSNTFNAIKGVFDTVFTAIGDVISGLLDSFGGFLDFITGVFSGDWEKAWNGICDHFKGIWDAIWGVVKGVVNLIIDGINLLWSGIYTAVSGIVNAVGGIAGALGDLFGQDWHFSMPEEPPLIPKLAQGAVLPPNKPFIAMLGDQKQGTNVEAPLSTIKQAMKEALAESGGAGQNARYEFIAKMNRRTIFDEIIEEAKLRQTISGVNPFVF